MLKWGCFKDQVPWPDCLIFSISACFLPTHCWYKGGLLDKSLVVQRLSSLCHSHLDLLAQFGVRTHLKLLSTFVCLCLGTLVYKLGGILFSSYEMRKEEMSQSNLVALMWNLSERWKCRSRGHQEISVVLCRKQVFGIKQMDATLSMFLPSYLIIVDLFNRTSACLQYQ